MKPGNLNLPIIWRGCDWDIITFKWKDLDGNPFNLTNWFPFASTTKFSLGARVTDAVHGVTVISLGHDATRELKQGEYEWSWLWSYLPTGIITPPVLAGRVIVKTPIFASPVAPPPGPSNGDGGPDAILPHPEPLVIA